MPSSRSSLRAALGITIFGYGLPVLGMPAVDFAAVYGSIFRPHIAMAPTEPAWCLGLLIHLAIAIIALPKIFGDWERRGILPDLRWGDGAIFGAALWLAFEILIKPLAGLGFLSAATTSGALTVTWLSLATWLSYGILLSIAFERQELPWNPNTERNHAV